MLLLAGQQRHPAAALDRLQLAMVAGDDDLAAVRGRLADDRGMSSSEVIEPSSSRISVPGRSVMAPQRAAGLGVWPRNCAVLYASTPAAVARTLRAAWLGASPITSPRHIRAACASTRVLPLPAGPTITETVRDLVTA